MTKGLYKDMGYLLFVIRENWRILTSVHFGVFLLTLYISYMNMLVC